MQETLIIIIMLNGCSVFLTLQVKLKQIKTVGISWHIYSLLDDSRQFLRIKTRLNNIFSEKDSRRRENDLLNHDILLILIKRVLLIGLSDDWMPKWRFVFVRQEKGKVCMLL